MAKKRNLVGAWAFLIGVILAVIFGFITFQSWLGWLLLVLGIVIGLLNIADTESHPFLMAGTVLVIVVALGGSAFSSTRLGVDFLSSIFDNILNLFVPATIVVALRSVFRMARG